ncbi:MAG TPA: VWA domain-containing protein [Spirochaetia bacterium]|nr:VWA domain-containing protein [Spirochaetia bacterium]
MWSFETPEALVLILVLPILIYLAHFRKNRGAKVIFSFRAYGAKGFNPQFGSGRLLRIAGLAFFWLGFAVLIVALAGPVRIEKRKVYLKPGLDIMFVLDESPSMLAQDFKPNHRFDAAKGVIRDFVGGRENDQIGLVVFSEEAVLLMPVTVDYSLLLSRLDTLEIKALSDGTAIGLGLSVAILHLNSATAAGKVIVLLTDGENNTGEVAPDAAARLARELGIRIYAIGIGQEGDVYMELKDPKTGKVIKGRYRGKFDEALLKEIAGLAGGRYFHASSPGTLTAIFEQIDAIEKTEKRVRVRVDKTSFHGELILAGIMLIVIDFLLRRGALGELM